jgi:hypothetical protein
VEPCTTKRKLAKSSFGLSTVIVKPEDALACLVGFSILGTVLLALFLADEEGVRKWFNSGGSWGEGMAIVYFVVIGLSFITSILIPGCLADKRKHPNRKAIWATTILFGWTFIGWGIALIWALTEPPPTIPPKESSPDR